MNFDETDVKFLLLDLAKQVMPEVGDKLGTRAMRVLRRRGVDVRLGLTLNEVYPDHVVLSDDSRIDGDAAAVPDVTQPGKITPPTAQHAIGQGKVLAHNVAAST
jgi:NADH:ubiquinone reductase (H+-translocating)